MSRDNTVTKHAHSSEPDYDTIETRPKPNRKPGYDVKVDANPAYHADVKMDANPAYRADVKTDANSSDHATS